MEIINVVTSLLFALILTLIIEIGVSILLKVKNKKDFYNIVYINCLTNITLNIIVLIINYLIKSASIILYIILVLEIIVVLVEYLFYKNRLVYDKINLLLFSLILNVSSFVLGLIIYSLI